MHVIIQCSAVQYILSSQAGSIRPQVYLTNPNFSLSFKKPGTFGGITCISQATDEGTEKIWTKSFVSRRVCVDLSRGLMGDAVSALTLRMLKQGDRSLHKHYRLTHMHRLVLARNTKMLWLWRDASARLLHVSKHTLHTLSRRSLISTYE